MRQGFLKLITAVTLLCAIGGGGYYFYSKRASTSQNHSDEGSETASFEEIQKALKAQNEAYLSSEEAKVFRQGNIVRAKEIIQSPTNDVERIKFFESGIHVLARGPTALTTEQYQELYNVTIDFVLEKKGNFLGKNARPATLAMRLLKSLPQPEKDSSNYKKTLSLLGNKSEKQLHQLGLEVTSTWKPLPAETENAIEQDLKNSKDINSSYNAIQMVNAVGDPGARDRLLKKVLSHYEKLPNEVRPLGLKVIAINADRLSIKIDSYVKEAAQRTEDAWLEAALTAIESSSSPAKFNQEIEGIASRTTNPMIHMRVKELVAKLQGGSR